MTNLMQRVVSALKAFGGPIVDRFTAFKRYERCVGCPHRASAPVEHCTLCGCALPEKVWFQEAYCPKGLW